MKLSSLQLEAFAEVARQSSFSKAARRLHLTQSALSQRVLKLEEELRTSLFVRGRDGARLTEAGGRLARYCRAQARLEDEARLELGALAATGAGRGRSAQVAQALSGTIRLGGYSTVATSLVMQRLAPLVAAHPNLGVELFSRELSELPGMLRSGEIDFAVLASDPGSAGLEATRIGQEVNALVEPGRGAPRPPPGVFLDHDPDDRTTDRFFALQSRAAAARFGYPGRRRYLDDIHGILRGVALGWGRAVVPLHLLDDRGMIRVVPGLKTLIDPVFLVHPRQSFPGALDSAVQSALRDF